jgi:hypothetical protein
MLVVSALSENNQVNAASEKLNAYVVATCEVACDVLDCACFGGEAFDWGDVHGVAFLLV